MGSLTDIVWSPNHDDKFCVIFKNIIFLLKISDYDGSAAEPERKIRIIGDKYKFKLILLNTCSDNDHVKAFAWRPSLDVKSPGQIIPPFLVALGLSSGSVKLTSLQAIDSNVDQFCLNQKELNSHANRNSTFLHWNPWRTSLLAHGLDRGKHNRSSSVLVWDVIQGGETKEPTDGSPDAESCNGLPNESLYYMDISVKGQKTQSVCDRPLCDACLNENAVSFAWVSKNSFVVGLINRQIKLYDISDTAKTIQMTQTRLVHGLTSDPLMPNRFASFSQNQIALWSSDNLEKPVYTFTVRKDVICLKWSPLREGWLGVLLVNSTDILVYNALVALSRPLEECEQFLFALRATTSRSGEQGVDPFVSFAWHGSIVNCILTIDRRGCLNALKVHEITAISWSPNHSLLWTIGPTWLGVDRVGLFSASGYASSLPNGGGGDDVHGGSTTPSSVVQNRPMGDTGGTSGAARQLSDQFMVSAGQLALRLDTNLDSIMQKRADAGYGIEVVNVPYSEIVADDSQLKSLWILLEYLQKYIDDWVPYGTCPEPSVPSLMRGRPSSVLSVAPPMNLPCQGAFAVLGCGDDFDDLASSFIGDTASTHSTEVIREAEWHGIDARLPFPQYSSPQRTRVQRMCMWPLDAASDVQRRVFDSICADLQFERAAAMALINLKFDWALSFLSRASEYRRAKENAEGATPQGTGAAPSSSTPTSTSACAPTPTATGPFPGGTTSDSQRTAPSATETDLIKVALSGFSDAGSGGSDSLWRIVCADMLGRLRHPYLRLMFKFLTTARSSTAAASAADCFEEILKNENLYLIDRLSFACLYLNDRELNDYVRTMTEQMVSQGCLDAVLLTGVASPQFFDLVQNYVDATGDVQTAAILGLHACQLCRRASPPPAQHSLPPLQAPPSAGPLGQSRLRSRGARDPLGRSSQLLGGLGSPLIPPPVDQVVAQLGGRRLANWVETYRDMLDRWRMWFYRVDFDNQCKTRLVTPYLRNTLSRSKGGGGGGGSVAAGGVGGGSAATSRDTLTSAPTTPAAVAAASGVASPPPSTAGTPSVVSTRLVSPIVPVRGIGLPAASSQVFMSCVYCGWRLGGVVRGIADDGGGSTPSSSSTTSSPVAGGFGGAAGGGAGSGGGTVHAGGGGKQSICWHCLKPLPRCSICLMHMGTEVRGESPFLPSAATVAAPAPADSGMLVSSTATAATACTGPSGPPTDATVMPEKSAGASVAVADDRRLEFIAARRRAEMGGSCSEASRGGALRLASWFVWCQACRHGGHASHIFNWFYNGGGGSPPTTVECPVNNCFCHCAGLDVALPPPRAVPRGPGHSLAPTPSSAVNREEQETRRLALPPLAISSESSSGSTSPRMMKRSSLASGNRREIVDPMVLAMDQQDGERDGRKS